MTRCAARCAPAAGRSEEPSAAIMDAQSIRASRNVPESSQGIDAGSR